MADDIGWAKELLAFDVLCVGWGRFGNTPLGAVGPSTSGAPIGLVGEKRVLPLMPRVAAVVDEGVVAPNEIAGVVGEKACVDGGENWMKS
jgi:hypothetical protein